MKDFSAKVLFLGEHTLVKGSKGLLFPYEKLFGRLEENAHKDFDRIQNLIDYFENSPVIKNMIDVDLLKKDVEKGLSFISDIPQGQGLGSSGALVAALLWKYGRDLPHKDLYTDEDLAFLKDILSLMESFYHGTSSGLDPLVSYVGKPLLVHSKNKITQVEFPKLSGKYQYFLISTNIQRKTSPLVHRFLEMCDKEEISKEDLDELLNKTNQCVDDFLAGNEDALFENFHSLSRLQYLNLAEMIPEKIKKLWFESLEDKKFLLKLCGAGGGGHFMGMAPKDFDLSSLGTTIKIF